MSRPKKRWICWPVFDHVCLQSGCLGCEDGEAKTHAEILDSPYWGQQEGHTLKNLDLGFVIGNRMVNRIR